MALNENTPALESKQSKWTAGDKRTMQFYGCRQKFTWTMSFKTRQPADAMRAAFGEELDVVTLLALERTPIVRDWQRFDSEYEIVDLGRNKKKAELTIQALKSQSSTERWLHQRAEPEQLMKVTEWCDKAQGRLDRQRESAATRVKTNGLEGLMGNAFKGLVREEALYPITRWISKQLKKDRDLLEVVNDAILGVRKKAAMFNPITSNDFEDTMRPLFKQMGRPMAMEALASFKSDIKEEWEARKEITDRRASVEKTASTLSKLGFKTEDL